MIPSGLFYWGPARAFGPGAAIPAPWLAHLDRLVDSLVAVDRAGADPRVILADHPWAALEPSVRSFPQGRPVEIAIA